MLNYQNSRLDLDEFICRILNTGSPGCSFTKTVKESEIIQLCQMAREVFLSQGPLIEIDAPVRLIGDIHGQFQDLLRFFDRAGFPPTQK